MEKSVDHEIWLHIFQWNPDKQSLPFEHEPAFKVGDDIWSVSAINANDYSLSKVTDVVKGELWIVKDKKTIKLACYCYETDGIFRIYDYNQPLRAFHTAKELSVYCRKEFDKDIEKLRDALVKLENRKMRVVDDIIEFDRARKENV
jgi:hypothetical protein